MKRRGCCGQSSLSLVGATANTADFFGGGSTPLTSATANVKVPVSKEAEAEAKLATLRAQLAKKPSAAAAKTLQSQIDAILKQYPSIAQREKAVADRTRQELVKSAAATAAINLPYQQQRAADTAAANRALAECVQRRGAECKYAWDTSVDLGLLPLGAKVLATGAAVVATGGLAAGAVAGGLTAASAATALTSTAAAVQGAKSIVSGKPTASLAVPGLSASGAASLISQGTGVAADKLLAAAEVGGELGAKARDVFDATKQLAVSGNPDAQAAINVLAKTAEARLKLELPSGVPQALTAKGEAAQAMFAAAPKLTANVIKASPSSASSPAPAPSSVSGVHVGLESGRVAFGAFRPVKAGTAGALFGVVVDDAGGRIHFDEYWVQA